MPWYARLSNTRTQSDILCLAQEYLEQLSPSELQQLPDDCRPGKLASEDDLADFASRLMAHHCHGDNARLVHRVADFLSKAAMRMQEIHQAR
jgi:hypothetical protein